jgi:hypothetical protein
MTNLYFLGLEREKKRKKGQSTTNYHIVTSRRKGRIDTSNGTTKEHFLPSRCVAHAIQIVQVPPTH